ncbi:GNAT family N-acetyltransferase [Streptomyces sp. NPDC058459]|uniref:GNAT family N-acetyltransferase n=1 Tax=Streptomyces sp. NPDC058459 TaxID=3346508 RepID=UPI003659A483
MTATYAARPASVARPALTAQLLTDENAFAVLAPAWGRLHRRCATATPFQSHAWLHSWWLSYGRPGRLRVLLVRSGRDLLAAAPLTLTRHPLPALVPLGGTVSDYGDVLLDDADDGRALSALTDALWTAARTALIDLRDVRPGGAAERVYDRWPGPRRRVPDSLCLELPPVSMAELLTRLPSGKAQRVRAKVRKLTALGVTRRTAGPGEAEAAVARLLELHRLQWQGRKVTPEHLRPRFREHLMRAVEPMVRSGDAVVTEFRIGEEVVAVDLTLLSPSLAGGYLYGAHPSLRERKADVAVMLLDACAAHTAAGSHGTLSLMRGDEPYKHHWRPDPVPSNRLLLARRRTAPLLSAALSDAAARRHGKAALTRLGERRPG